LFSILVLNLPSLFRHNVLLLTSYCPQQDNRLSTHPRQVLLLSSQIGCLAFRMPLGPPGLWILHSPPQASNRPSFPVAEALPRGAGRRFLCISVRYRPTRGSAKQRPGRHPYLNTIEIPLTRKSSTRNATSNRPRMDSFSHPRSNLSCHSLDGSRVNIPSVLNLTPAFAFKHPHFSPTVKYQCFSKMENLPTTEMPPLQSPHDPPPVLSAPHPPSSSLPSPLKLDERRTGLAWARAGGDDAELDRTWG
jgi:hypothetical protein